MTWKNETTRQPLPAPLPMYEPVRLKHVPTFVRRRYDRDLKKIDDVNEVLSSEEGKGDGDGVEDNDDLTIISDVGDSVDNNEVEDDTHANFDTEHDTRSNTEEFGSSNIESSSSTCDGDSKIKDDKDQDANDTFSYVDANVEDNTQDQSHAKSHMNDHGSYSKDCEDEDDGAKDVDFVSFVDGSIENDFHDNEQGSNSMDKKYEVDGPEDVTPLDYVDASVKNEVQDNEQGVYLGFHEQDSKIDDDGTKDGIIASCYDNGSVQDEVQDDDEHGNFDKERQGLPEEDDKSEGDKAEDVIHDNVDYAAEDDEQANNFDTKHDTNEDTSVDNGAQHNEQGVYVGFHEQDNNINDDGTNDGIFASSYGNGSDQDKVEDDEHGIFDKEQAFPEEDDKSEVNRVEDVIHDATGLDLDNSDYEVEDDAQAKLDTKHDKKTYTTENSDNNSLEETKFEGEIQQRDGASLVEASVDEDSIKNNDGHENSDIKHQDLLVSDCEKIEDGIVANHIVDESFKLEEIIEKQHEDLDIKQGIYQAQSPSFAPTPWLARRLIQVQWDPSPLNFHKLNFDGLSTSSPKVGIIIRDAHGVILSAQVYKMSAISPVLAEAWALRNGLLQANKLGRSNLCNEGDNRLHIRMISRDYQCPWNLQFLVEDSKHLH